MHAQKQPRLVICQNVTSQLLLKQLTVSVPDWCLLRNSHIFWHLVLMPSTKVAQLPISCSHWEWSLLTLPSPFCLKFPDLKELESSWTLLRWISVTWHKAVCQDDGSGGANSALPLKAMPVMHVWTADLYPPPAGSLYKNPEQVSAVPPLLPPLPPPTEHHNNNKLWELL